MRGSISLFKIFIFLILVVIVASVVIKYNKKDKPVYMEFWYDTTFDSDIDLYSSGSSEGGEKIYLGAKPIHYIIQEDGSLYMKQEGLYKDAETGEVDPETVIFVRKLSDNDLKKLRNELRKTVKSKKDETGFPVNFGDEFWYVKIGEKTTRVKAKLKISVVDTYFK